MSTVTVTHSHAAPQMRRRLIDTISVAMHSKVKRDRLAGFRAAGTWASALQLLDAAEDYQNVEGISDLDTAPVDAIRETLRFLGSGPEKVLSKEGVVAMQVQIDRFDAIQSGER